MLRRFSLLFVGVLAAVGVGTSFDAATALPSKHWPMTAKTQAVGVLATVGVLLALIWVLMTGFSPVLLAGSRINPFMW